MQRLWSADELGERVLTFSTLSRRAETVEVDLPRKSEEFLMMKEPLHLDRP